MITRNRLVGLVVLLAGLTAGYFASRVMQKRAVEIGSDLPVYYSRVEIPAASMANFFTIYKSSKEQFTQVLNQGQEKMREAARRSQVLQQSQERVTTHPEAYEQLILQSEREIDILRLLDYYNQFYLHYCRWLDTGNAQSAVQYKLSLGQFKATLDYVGETQLEDPVLTTRETEELRTVIRIVEQTNRTIRWSRLVVVILLFLLLMGIPHLIRDSGLKKFAGALYFDALFRPNHISELNRWHSLQRMTLLLPVIYLFSLVIISSFISWKVVLIFGSLGLIPVIILAGLSGVRTKLSPVLLSYMAPKMLLVIFVLGVVAMRGPNFLWYGIWDGDLFRTLFISLFFLTIFRKVHVDVILARKWSHRNRIGSAAMVGLAIGIQFLVAGALMYGFGPEESLLALNSELMLVPAYMIEAPLLHLNSLMIVAGIITISSFSIFIFNIRRKHVPSRRVKS